MLGLISAGAWDRFFQIEETTYRDLTLEVLTILKVDKAYLCWDRDDIIEFQVLVTLHTMS